MRFIVLALLVSLFASCASTQKATPSSLEIKDIKPRFIEEVQFKRIGEYLTGKEDTGGRVIIRSDREERTGYYFTLVLDENVRKLPKGTFIVGEFFTPQSLDAQTRDFVLPNKRPSTKEVFIGLTGKDWPQNSGVPSAWRFTIKDANGNIMAEKQSYLWSL